MSRLEAAVKAWDHFWGDRYGDEALEEMGDEVKVALEAADAYDAAHNVHRVVLSDATVERARKVLISCLTSPYMTNEQIARAVLAAAVKEER